MRRWVLAGAAWAMAAGPAQAQGSAPAGDPGPSGPIQYELRFPNAAHHEAAITATFRQLRPGAARFRMARSSPGRYAIHEFAKNVYSVTATDGRGRKLTVTQADPYSWSVDGHDGTVRIAYTLYGDHGDGTYAQIDTSHAHLNMPATLMWAEGYDDRAIRVRFYPADAKWKVATQLPEAIGPTTFWAPNLQYLMDSPVELSDHEVREWTVGEGATRQTVRLAVHHLGSAAEVDTFAAKAKRVVEQQYAIFGGPPRYDHGRYTFLADYLPWIDGDGMEHRNSTVISQPRGLAEANFDQIQTLSHEFIHQWNVERIRPAELEPFDFTRANPTPSLWLAEGFTQYYGPLSVRRAGEMTVDTYLATLGRTIGGVINSPARRYGGPQAMSLRAPFVDAARSIDAVNPNVFVSYYPYGATIALALDLQLRERFPGKTLDDFMRALWQAHGVPERPYRPDDLKRVLAAVTGDAGFADAFFAATVEGSSLPDFAPLLARAGLVLRPARAGRGWLGAVRAGMEDGIVTLAEPPVPDSPLYRAGVERGDTLVAIDGVALSGVDAWNAAQEGWTPRRKVRLTVRQRGRERQVEVTAVVDPTLEIVRAETTGTPLTPAQRAFRTAWLGEE